MPNYTVELMQDELNKIGLPVKDTTIGVLGVAYKADIDDIRESPSFDIIRFLKEMGAKVLVYDPHIPETSTEESLDDILKSAPYLMSF